MGHHTHSDILGISLLTEVLEEYEKRKSKVRPFPSDGAPPPPEVQEYIDKIARQDNEYRQSIQPKSKEENKK